MASSVQAVLHGSELRKEFGNIQEFWIWKHQGHVRYYENDDWRKFRKLKMYFPHMLRVHCGKKSVLLNDQALKWTKARAYVYSDSVLCTGKMHGPEDAIKRWEWSCANFEDVSHLQRIARVGWRADWLWVEDFPRSNSIGSSPRNSADLQGKLVDRIIFMSMFNDIVLEEKGIENSCAVTSRKTNEYASKFNDGHWAFLGPGEESKRHQWHATNYGGKWNLRASSLFSHCLLRLTARRATSLASVLFDWCASTCLTVRCLPSWWTFLRPHHDPHVSSLRFRSDALHFSFPKSIDHSFAVDVGP